MKKIQKEGIKKLFASTNKIIRAFMVVLNTCENEEDSIKNGGARVFTRLYIDFSDAQGPRTPQTMVESGPNANSSKLLWLSL